MNRTVYGIVQPLDYVEPKRHRHNTASALGMDIIRVGGWARNADRLIRVILGAEEEEVEHDPEAGEWIQSAGRLARIGFGLMFVGITAWSTAALASAGSGFTLGRSEYIGLLAVAVTGLLLLSCKFIAGQSWWRPSDKLRALLEDAANVAEAAHMGNTFLVANELFDIKDELRRLRIPVPDDDASPETWYAYLTDLQRRAGKRGMKSARGIRPDRFVNAQPDER